jgi:environmental stress-induced protein Ves
MNASRPPEGIVWIDAASVAPQAWRNGGGQTRELLAWPAGADWRLRISRADIASDGPFSAFPGVERWFAVLQGAGVVLAFADAQHQLQPGDAPLRFDGAAAPGCRLLDGATQDLNLMLRHARALHHRGG